ncbi:aminotransferase class I/II-fold pyridoxal phosphate-dependent enzyme [Sporosarcina sp. 6E9]|uniref:aminotransferase class I/II-fold pyridoxal phosphate-dependent enzyme n=1 Tax=Sporosarcina sp. 6E9 TaxID=2819235 RepID=UPI001B30E836|nr:aminotransferase class I/II-fold pyridoxal phosphate-dependent enzyme [Sporosarcina sp. 6E9]
MDYANRPLVHRLMKFKEADPISFHVPGHKNGALTGLPMELRTALTFDFTELEGLDDLHQPEGVIREAEQKLTNFYRSNKSFFLINGSTVGNLAMIYATCAEGETVIVQRNAHKSIFNAIELTGARPVFISPEWDSASKTAGTVTPEQVKNALTRFPEAKAVILTYPTYYGTTGDKLEETIRLCHEREIPVLVDEAHGAHFAIGEPFPTSALDLGADIVVHSAHKTLPALTMASFLHVRSNLITPEKVARYLQMLQSSSPSYLLMASLDDAREYVESYAVEDGRDFMKRRAVFLKRLTETGHLEIIETDDSLKLMLRVNGYSGYDLQKALDQVGVYAELADFYQVLLVLPLLKKGQEYPFEKAVKRIEKAIEDMINSKVKRQLPGLPVFDQLISKPCYIMKEVEKLHAEWIPYEEAVGKIAAASLIPYPPGIPLLLAGERITEYHLQSLTSLLATGARFQGAIRLHEKQIFVVTNEAEE